MIDVTAEFKRRKTMQPIISADHESRHSSYREVQVPHVDEETPLLRPQPPATVLSQPRDPLATAIIALLLIVLILGVIIGIYLLVVQSKSENILPPVNTPLQFVSQSQWNFNGTQHLGHRDAPRKADSVIIVQTDTDPCDSGPTCSLYLRNFQFKSANRSLPYNFLVSTNGQTFEALGWGQQSPLFPQHNSSLVLAFIGNFTETEPSSAQLDEAKSFFAESVSLRHLDPTYSIIGKNTLFKPKYLFKKISHFPHWNANLSDAEL